MRTNNGITPAIPDLVCLDPSAVSILRVRDQPLIDGLLGWVFLTDCRTFEFNTNSQLTFHTKHLSQQQTRTRASKVLGVHIQGIPWVYSKGGGWMGSLTSPRNVV